MSGKRPLAVILTALSVEAKAVRAMMNEPTEVRAVQNTCYDFGWFSMDNGASCHVAVTQIGMGIEAALMEANNVISNLKPDCLLFVGVAGGVKDVDIGDIIAADKVYGYEGAKIGVKVKARPEAAYPNDKLLSLARNIAGKDEWQARINHDWLSSELHRRGIQRTNAARRIPEAVVGPVATGGKVVASTESGYLNELINEAYNDTLAVEMEGFGCLRGVRGKELPAIVIRGISDRLDGKGAADASGSQQIASAHAAAFAFELLYQFFPSQKFEGKQLIQAGKTLSDGNGTKIPTSEFDQTIQDRINELFKADDFQEVQIKICELSGQKDLSGIGELLCSPDVGIESVIGWLNRAAAEVVQAMPRDLAGEKQRQSFKDNAKKVLGWLVLRTVDPAWIEQHAAELKQEQGARLTVRMENESGVEVIVARTFEHESKFHGTSKQVRGCNAIGWLRTEGGIEPSTNLDALIRATYKHVWRKEITGTVTDNDKEKLRRRLKNHLLSGLRYYLTVHLDDELDLPLKNEDLQEFHRQFPYLKLILLRMNSGKSALLIDDGDLYDLISAFFLRVIEEQA